MRIIVIGCGRVGSGLAKTLGMQRHAVAVVDRDPAAFVRLGPAFAGETVAGLGVDRDVLARAGIERADGLAAVTGSDEVNVVVGRVAREIYRVPRVVARVYEPGTAEVYHRLGLQTISPVSWGIRRIADLLTFSQLDVRASLGGGEVDLVDVDVPPSWGGRSVEDLTVPGEIQVVAISRAGRAFLPGGATLLRDGDVLHVAVTAASSRRLDVMLTP